MAKQTRIVLETTTVPEFSTGLYLAPTKTEKNWRFFVDLKADKASTPKKEEQAPPPEKDIVDSQPTEQVKRLKKPLVVLDPGHGGTDPGAISISGKYEKNLTLKMAQETKKVLEKTGKYRVLLTRDTDKALALRDRIRFAHKHEADLFISIHADSAKNKKASGLSVYTISEKASDKEAQMLAERENKADIILGIDLSNELPEVSNILIDLAKRDTMDKSAHYANLLVQKMAKNVTLVPNAHRFAGFVVLKSPSIPSVLIEIGYLSNPKEEKLLQNSAYRGKLANSIVQAVDNYFDTVYY
ncbi:MAG: N-acetylmuramoyl-L-alanine amidase [Alphaproteobacteria bacterium]|nr:N-acetylmuramoyl-L-alanine amidase [Alphaproteobacteria bacterium]